VISCCRRKGCLEHVKLALEHRCELGPADLTLPCDLSVIYTHELDCILHESTSRSFKILLGWL
jgi:hypothetical protein